MGACPPTKGGTGTGAPTREHTCGEQTGATSRRRLEASTPESDPTLPHWKRRCHDRAREDWYLGGRDASPKRGRRDGRIRRAGSAPRRVVTPLEETCFPAEPRSAICVQRFDDSLNSAIRTTYRISLRSSSLREPRYPSAGVVCWLLTEDTRHRRAHSKRRRAPTRERPERDPRRLGGARARARNDGRRQEGGAPTEEATTAPRTPPEGREKERRRLPRGIAALWKSAPRLGNSTHGAVWKDR